MSLQELVSHGIENVKIRRINGITTKLYQDWDIRERVDYSFDHSFKAMKNPILM